MGYPATQPESLQLYQSVNPVDGSVMASFPLTTPKDVDVITGAAVRAQREWRQTPIVDRANLLANIARLLRDDADNLARLATLEMGKTLAEARAEVLKCAWCCEFYASEGPGFLEPLPVATSATESMIVMDPIGIILGIMPWNYPYWQVIRVLAPVLLIGNGMLVKHAENVPQCAQALGDIFDKAGLPEGLVANLFVTQAAVSNIINDGRVAAVSLTGSTRAGAAVASQAGAAIKRQVLELGGSDPFVVLADANLQLAASAAVQARFQNNGQSCLAAKRFIVVEEIADKFVALLRERIEKLEVGDPMQSQTQVGPLAKISACSDLTSAIEQSISLGAELLLGGHKLGRIGNFFAPTLLDKVKPGMAAFDEETFGPVAAVSRCRDLDDAIELANSSQYGLGAAIWTADRMKAIRFAQSVDSGMVVVNGVVASDPRLPIGGVKRSGYGRELGADALREFANVKSICINEMPCEGALS
ncbi:NAD-dependent succinate-semialdehyde dehydrogenase [Microvirga zambiensis]|uniref:NAD-dependent succinate-semialdehyde dehydrogenase n=1 Tax=Microvirga zambiensis TaxID=1402137 RepID=UPI00191E7A70|nr:NAD-dependent succinate-semialdehyde dehydrogenase [Microvirga zambiensis]